MTGSTFLNSLPKWLLLAGTTMVSACAADGGAPVPERAATEPQQPTPAFWRERYLLLGRQTYERACASCHDEGIGTAPAIGDHENWSDRSPLWSAVLLRHAKNGYLAMPARGGHAELTDRDVEAAGEYMLSETFPELHRD